MEQIIETPKQAPYEKFRSMFGETMSKIENNEEIGSEELFSLVIGMTDTMVEVLDENENTLRKYFEENHKLKAQVDRLYVKNKRITACMDDLPALIRSNGVVPTFSANEFSKDFKVVTLSSFMKENGIYYQKLMKILKEAGVMYYDGKNCKLSGEYSDKGYAIYVNGHNRHYSEAILMWTEAGVEFLKELVSNYNKKPKNTEAPVETQTE